MNNLKNLKIQINKKYKVLEDFIRHLFKLFIGKIVLLKINYLNVCKHGNVELTYL